MAHHVEQALRRVSGVPEVRVEYPKCRREDRKQFPLAINTLNGRAAQKLQNKVSSQTMRTTGNDFELAARQAIGAFGGIWPTVRLGDAADHDLRTDCRTVGHISRETMPTDRASTLRLSGCGTLLRPSGGLLRVLSYGSVPCPPYKAKFNRLLAHAEHRER